MSVHVICIYFNIFGRSWLPKKKKIIKQSKGNLFQQQNEKYLVNEAILNLEETQNVDRYVIDFEDFWKAKTSG